MVADLGQWEFVTPRLRQIALWLEESTGLIFTITSLYRIGDAGNHGQLPLRAVDLRCRHIGLANFIADLINDAWEYDHERPNMKVAIAHGKGSHLHIHLQVHDNTTRR